MKNKDKKTRNNKSFNISLPIPTLTTFKKWRDENKGKMKNIYPQKNVMPKYIPHIMMLKIFQTYIDRNYKKAQILTQ